MEARRTRFYLSDLADSFAGLPPAVILVCGNDQDGVAWLIRVSFFKIVINKIVLGS